MLLETALLRFAETEAHSSKEIICCVALRCVLYLIRSQRLSFLYSAKRLGNQVGYQIRMESKRSKNTKLLFCTTGVILRRLQDDHSLKSITHVIVDEVHERQVQTDVLLIALRQLLRTTRTDLKVILVRNQDCSGRIMCVMFEVFPVVTSAYLSDIFRPTQFQ